MSFGTAPTVPTALQVYNSYLIDPEWQTKFSIIWGSCLGVAFLFASPRLVRAVRSGRLFTGFWGIRETWDGRGRYEVPVDKEKGTRTKTKMKTRSGPTIWGKIDGISSAISSFSLWTLPGLGLNTGQIFVIIAYLLIVLVCIIMGAQLVSNSNRGGFLALAQLPVVFLFGTKNSIVSLILGPGGGSGYEKLNYIHRWSGRCLFLAAVLHGSLWIRNHLIYDIQIIGAQKETSGVAALGVLCGIVLTSLKPVRKMFWDFFWVVHVLGFVSFFITICYHSIYAIPWIFPPVAFYAADLLMRMLRVRIKDATLTSVDHGMTLIRIQDCDSNWLAGQHIRLRVFFSGRVFESHPLTIMNAPGNITCLDSPTSTESGRSIILGARVNGDWTRALNKYAESEGKIVQAGSAMWVAEKKATASSTSSIISTDVPPTLPSVPVQVMLDGPYGGCSLDLGRYETVLLIAGGSGATFTLGLLDDIVGRCTRLARPRGEKTRRIEFVWCIRSYGGIHWFSSVLLPIANMAAESTDLDLHVSIYVTCLCNPEAVPVIPNSDVLMLAQRPATWKILEDLTREPRRGVCSCGNGECVCGNACAPSSNSSTDDLGGVTEIPRKKFTGMPPDPEACATLAEASAKLQWVGLGGGVAVCASGPQSLTREASNAVAKLSLLRGVELGGVGLHTEVFST
ncbi:ferric reductase like transmembrane component-domain-containing protein [Rhodocollybia butyracea]|uniref:Ferric reductase like transmembrane component-domain-containing protein n=1 Tax=Rhodocollybia butyracea TaxID=206335 RepID=A0A9P5Q2F7_9AGAR|nr:ferric reductase like transmembrane component-domain-containing protein [Rhodocollybia butyracea]